ncbi:hypothetical protein NSK_008160 [Nannochloropsis salina CCMP1776]|uniref:Uncharacterized protein n=1 Tax=Nannochloropsis salina CCMP1776 TaxID=1027361 RepID=A0A4D9CUU4_9STRA|nr:hypothetical protein NSK_008160 [Nannochloropsis salina CCMP1776]|eukprot:TFJ80419.1 hypothetical protein NSK_008160 [Nannochloropsis salina CCMP1776]
MPTLQRAPYHTRALKKGVGRKVPRLGHVVNASHRQAQSAHETHAFIKEKDLLLSPLAPVAAVKGGADKEGGRKWGPLVFMWTVITQTGTRK